MTLKLPEPMNLREAIEAIKVLKRHLPAISQETKPLDLLGELLESIQEINPTDSLMLVSLMHHKSLEETAELFQDADGKVLIAALSDGFAANPIPDLVNSGAMIGLIDSGWNE